MKKLYILPFLAAGILLSGCSKENPWGPENEGEGQFLKSSLSMDINANGLVKNSSAKRSEVDVNVDDFTVIFTKDGQSTPFSKYRYGDMPEVITLPAGAYTCTATYGENRQAEWECPYFLGVSETFDVVANEITSYVSPIVCRLENIKVTVDFDSALRAAMSADSYVEVKVGNSGSLNYGLAEADAQKAGFFMHTGEVSLVATFHGVVNGSEIVESKALENVDKGNHYKVVFRLHNGGSGQGEGDVNGNVNVDAGVTVVDVERNVEVGDDPLIDVTDRPSEDDPDDPNPPTPPVQEPPVISGLGKVNIDAVNQGADFMDGTPFVIGIESTADAGLTVFDVQIVSATLNAEQLESVGLSDHLDLINPGSLAESLQGLGLLVKFDADGNKILGPDGKPVPETSFAGYKKVKFDLSGFMELLGGLGHDYHEFVLTVADANGTTTKTVKIQM